MTVFPTDISLENVPRYTSYPTAPHFHPGVGSSQFDSWLRAIEPSQTVSSLYPYTVLRPAMLVLRMRHQTYPAL